MTTLMTTLLAIYGAMLSTLLGALQIRTYLEAQRYVHVNIRRGWRGGYECIEFLISNRSHQHATEIRYVTIGFYEFHGRSPGRFFHPIDVKKGVEPGEVVKLPLFLKPGEIVTCEYTSDEAVRFLKTLYDEGEKSPNSKNSNLFFIEIEHSRSNNPKRILFEMGLKRLSGYASPWKKLARWPQRFLLRPASRSLGG